MALSRWATATSGPTASQPRFAARTEWPQPRSARGTSTERPVPGERPAESAERVFAGLAEQWRRETAPLSSVTEIVLHPAYQRIIGMGRDALPLILADLVRRPDHWFWALRAITGENPVTDRDRGDLRRMRDAWVRLGRERGWLG